MFIKLNEFLFKEIATNICSFKTKKKMIFDQLAATVNIDSTN